MHKDTKKAFSMKTPKRIILTLKNSVFNIFRLSHVKAQKLWGGNKKVSKDCRGIYYGKKISMVW